MPNPFRRKRRSPIDQALDVAGNVRSDAAELAGTIRDAAARAADALGEAAPPVPSGRRLPLAAAGLAAGLAVILLVRRRASGPSEAETYTAPSVSIAASETAAAPEPAAAPKPAADVAPEEPKEPRASTGESEVASG